MNRTSNLNEVRRRKKFKKFDFILFFTTIALCIYGLTLIKSATLNLGTNRYVRSQLIAIILGLIFIVALVFIDYKILGRLYIPIYVLSNMLLIIVLIFGFGEDDWGSRSWLSLGGIVFQPAEFVKLGLIISLSKFIDNNKDSLNQPATLIKILAFAGLPILLIMIQPDAGTAMVFIFFIAAMLFIAGLDWKYIKSAVIALVVSLPFIWLRLDVYQKNRIFDFLNPGDMSGSGYQMTHGKIAIGSGKFWGRGLFKGVQVQNNYVPEAPTDFIFSVLVEELGFVGGFFLICLYLLLIYRLIKIARESKDLFGSLMVIGVAAMFIFHIYENIGMTIGLMPVTGIPLPFISHGGTFLLINMIGIGIALSVNYHKDGLNF